MSEHSIIGKNKVIYSIGFSIIYIPILMLLLEKDFTEALIQTIITLLLLLFVIDPIVVKWNKYLDKKSKLKKEDAG